MNGIFIRINFIIIRISNCISQLIFIIRLIKFKPLCLRNVIPFIVVLNSNRIGN